MLDPNQTVQFGHTVTLRGTVFDPDGDSTTVLWTLIGGTGSNGIQINGANSPTATFTAPSEPRVLTFQFCANDGEALPVCATTQVTVVAHTADLSITIGDSPDPVIVGDTLTYTLTAINNGPGDATGVTLTDRLPTGVTFVSASASAAQSVKAVHTDFSKLPFDGRAAVISVTVSAELGDLASGEEATLNITVKADSVGDLTNTAEVAGNEVDSNASNNTATENTQVLAQPAPAPPTDTIPTLSEWGLILLLIGLLGGGIYRLRNRRRTA